MHKLTYLLALTRTNGLTHKVCETTDYSGDTLEKKSVVFYPYFSTIFQRSHSPGSNLSKGVTTTKLGHIFSYTKRKGECRQTILFYGRV